MDSAKRSAALNGPVKEKFGQLEAQELQKKSKIKKEKKEGKDDKKKKKKSKKKDKKTDRGDIIKLKDICDYEPVSALKDLINELIKERGTVNLKITLKNKDSCPEAYHMFQMADSITKDVAEKDIPNSPEKQERLSPIPERSYDTQPHDRSNTQESYYRPRKENTRIEDEHSPELGDRFRDDSDNDKVGEGSEAIIKELEQIVMGSNEDINKKVHQRYKVRRNENEMRKSTEVVVTSYNRDDSGPGKTTTPQKRFTNYRDIMDSFNGQGNDQLNQFSHDTFYREPPQKSIEFNQSISFKHPKASHQEMLSFQEHQMDMIQNREEVQRPLAPNNSGQKLIKTLEFIRSSTDVTHQRNASSKPERKAEYRRTTFVSITPLERGKVTTAEMNYSQISRIETANQTQLNQAHFAAPHVYSSTSQGFFQNRSRSIPPNRNMNTVPGNARGFNHQVTRASAFNETKVVGGFEDRRASTYTQQPAKTQVGGQRPPLDPVLISRQNQMQSAYSTFQSHGGETNGMAKSRYFGGSIASPPPFYQQQTNRVYLRGTTPEKQSRSPGMLRGRDTNETDIRSIGGYTTNVFRSPPDHLKRTQISGMQEIQRSQNQNPIHGRLFNQQSNAKNPLGTAFGGNFRQDEERQFLVIDEYDSLPPETQDKIKSIALDHNGRNKVYLQDSPVQLEGLKEDIFREISLAQVKGNTNKP